jgi:hypothetical protein
MSMAKYQKLQKVPTINDVSIAGEIKPMTSKDIP